MEKAKLKYIEEQCNRIANGMERISGFTGKGQLYIYEHVDIDYEEIKDKFPDPDEADNDLSRAQNILDGVKADDEGTKGGTPEPTE